MTFNINGNDSLENMIAKKSLQIAKAKFANANPSNQGMFEKQIHQMNMNKKLMKNAEPQKDKKH